MKTFKFLTNTIEHQAVGLKGEREYYVTGYISTDEIDRANEVVTREAMNEMVAQIKAGNVKLDVEHSTFTGENDIPIGKILDAGIDEKGVWVKCMLNKAHSKFNEYWQSIKSNFLDAFSIAYKVNEYAEEVINGVTVTLLKSIELLNVAITGNPVNRGSKMTESFYKSLKHLKENNLKGEPIMTEQIPVEPVQPAPAEPTIVEPAPAPVVEPKQEPITTPEPAIAAVPEPAPVPVPEPIVPEPAAPVVAAVPAEPEPMVNPLDRIKSLTAINAVLKAEFDKTKKELQDLKAELNKPVLKSLIEPNTPAKVPSTEEGPVITNVLDVLR